MIHVRLQDIWFSTKISLYLSYLAEQRGSLRCEIVFLSNEARGIQRESHPSDIDSKHN